MAESPTPPPAGHNPSLTAGLTHAQKTRILKCVILGVDPPKDETPDARDWRERMEKNVAADREAGYAPEIPWDAHDPDA